MDLGRNLRLSSSFNEFALIVSKAVRPVKLTLAICRIFLMVYLEQPSVNLWSQ